MLSTLIRSAQCILLFVSSFSIGTAMDHYRSLYRLAASTRPIETSVLSSFPESLRWYVLIFGVGLIGIVLLQRVYDKLRSNNSFKPTPLRGAA